MCLFQSSLGRAKFNKKGLDFGMTAMITLLCKGLTKAALDIWRSIDDAISRKGLRRGEAFLGTSKASRLRRGVVILIYPRVCGGAYIDIEDIGKR